MTFTGNVTGPGAVPPFPQANLTYPNGSIVSFGGTDYVFAGGRAFPVPNPPALTKIKKVDKAKVLAGSVSSAQTGATIADGVLLSTSGIVYVSYDGQLWPFGSLKQLSADGYGGTAAVSVAGTSGISVVSNYSGS